jgi:hypothetical protein
MSFSKLSAFRSSARVGIRKLTPGKTYRNETISQVRIQQHTTLLEKGYLQGAKINSNDKLCTTNCAGPSIHSNKQIRSASTLFQKNHDFVQKRALSGKATTKEDCTFIDFQFETLNELLEKTVKFHSANKVFGTRVDDGYEWMSYSEFNFFVEKTRTFLALHHQVQANDKVSLISNNRWEWATVVYATFGLGAQIVPMYEAQLESDWTYIIKDSDAKVLIVSTEAIYNVVKNYVDKVWQNIKRFLLVNSSFVA